MTYEEMEKELIAENGEKYVLHMTAFKEALQQDQTLDSRMFAAKVVEEAWKWMKDKNPAMILFYSSIYSPRIELTGETEDERTLVEALEQAVKTVQPAYPHPIVTRNFFPYISDMSFVALSDDDEGLKAITDNNPSWGRKHFINFDDIREERHACFDDTKCDSECYRGEDEGGKGCWASALGF